MLSFTKGAESLSIFLDGVFHSIDRSHINYGVLDAELAKPRDERRLDMIRSCVSIKAMIEVMTFGNLTISETEVLFEGTKIGGLMAERMLMMLGKGLDIAPFANFMNNVFANPAMYTRDELHQWMKKARLPITPDGCLLAFKIVRDDYTDHHTGKCDNTPGNTLEMDRSACDPNRHETCSTGFHFASPGYFNDYYSGRKLVVKVNPRDITAIPSDYKFTKGRTCRYQVVAEIPNDKDADAFWQTEVVDLSGDVPAWISYAPLNGIVIGADGDPSDAVIAEAQQVAPYKTDDRIFIICDRYHQGKAATVSYCEPDGTVWAFVDDRLAPSVKNCFPRENVRLLTQDDITAVEAAASAIEEGTTDAGKGTIVAATMLPGRINPTLLGDQSDSVFTTTDGREFSADVIKTALDDASIRGAARNLGVQDSTLRGWKKKLGL